jgi:hypothetical protein
MDRTYLIIAKVFNQWFESICHMLRGVRVDDQDSDLCRCRRVGHCVRLWQSSRRLRLGHEDAGLLKSKLWGQFQLLEIAQEKLFL